MNDLNKVIDNDTHNVPSDAVDDIMDSRSNYSIESPKSSINGSLRGSRCGSLRSISSLANNRSNSPLSGSELSALRRDRSETIRSSVNVGGSTLLLDLFKFVQHSPQYRLSRISLPCHQTVRFGEDKADINSLYFNMV